MKFLTRLLCALAVVALLAVTGCRAKQKCAAYDSVPVTAVED